MGQASERPDANRSHCKKTMAIMEAWSCYMLCLSMTRQDTFVIMGEPFIWS